MTVTRKPKAESAEESVEDDEQKDEQKDGQDEVLPSPRTFYYQWCTYVCSDDSPDPTPVRY